MKKIEEKIGIEIYSERGGKIANTLNVF